MGKITITAILFLFSSIQIFSQASDAQSNPAHNTTRMDAMQAENKLPVSDGYESARMEITEAKVIGEQLVINFILIDDEKDEQFWLQGAKARIVDADGEVHRVIKCRMGDKEHNGGANMTGKLVKGVPVSGTFVFSGKPAEADSILLLEIPATIKSSDHSFDLQFRSVPVARKEMQGFMDEFCIEEGVTMQIKSVSIEKSECKVKFIIKGIDTDRKFNIRFLGQKIYGGDGTIYELKKGSFAGKSGNGYTTVNTVLPGDIPVKGEFIFDLKGQQPGNILMVEINLWGNKFRIRDIKLS